MPASKQAGMYGLNHWIPTFACLQQAGRNDEREVVYLGLIVKIGGIYAGASLSRSCLGLIPGTFKAQRPVSLAYSDPRAGGEFAREYFFGNRRGQFRLDGAF